jgi:hypothetical protein
MLNVQQQVNRPENPKVVSKNFGFLVEASHFISLFIWNE